MTVKDNDIQEEQLNHEEASLPNDEVDIQLLLDKKEQQIGELENRMLRLQADFDNFRRRARAEKEDLYRYANKDFIAELLPVVDNFERALMAKEDAKDPFVAGVKMIYQQLMGVLTKEGLSAIEALGKDFDPNIHEAVMMVNESEQPPNTVVEELQKGYMFNEKLVRTSMVKVANSK